MAVPVPRTVKPPVRRPPTPSQQHANALARMPQLTATPGNLVDAGNAIAQYLGQHRFSFPATPQISVFPQDQMQGLSLQGGDPLAQALPGGAVHLTQRMADLGVNGQSVTELLHELLHTTATGGNPSGANRDQMAATEQATETMAQDMLPGVMHYLRVPANSGASLSYKPYVMAERYASAKATGTNWTSPQSRAWRANQFFTQPAQRQLINYPS
jgi:hypothetical protein